MKRESFFAGILTLSLASLLLLGGCGKTNGIPEPNLPMSGLAGEVCFEVISDLSFPAADEVEVSRFAAQEPGARLTEAREVLGIAESDFGESAQNSLGTIYSLSSDGQDATFFLDSATGYWQYRYSGHGPPASEPIGRENAVEIAKQFVIESGLFDGNLGEASVGTETRGSEFETGGEQFRAWIVSFSPQIDNTPVYGLYRIVVDVGADGAIRGVLNQTAPFESAGAVPLKTRETVLAELQEQSDTLSTNVAGLSGAVVNDCELAYYVDGYAYNGRAYICPVYVLTGTGSAADGSTADFSITLDAVQRG